MTILPKKRKTKKTVGIKREEKTPIRITVLDVWFKRTVIF